MQGFKGGKATPEVLPCGGSGGGGVCVRAGWWGELLTVRRNGEIPSVWRIGLGA